MLIDLNPASFWLTRIVLQRTLAFVYLIAFLIALNQFVPLCGAQGLTPAKLFLRRIQFWDAPSIFYWQSSDIFFKIIAGVGIALALFALTGLSESFGIWVSAAVWFLLWLFYLSFVNVGQTFYGFGWETLLLETGFLAIFLGASNTPPSKIIIWLFRWVLFRVMFGAGLIKLRGDSCWRDLTCMNYHYETQPLPGPLSWFFHHLPGGFHKLEVLFTHFVELVVPFGYLIPGPIGVIAGLITIVFHGLLILSGNLSWLNYITLVLSFACLDDRFLSPLLSINIPEIAAASWARQGVVYLLTGLILYLSIQPTINLFSRSQIMNTSFDPLHLVNTYGAFGSITRQRTEIVFEGTRDADPENPETKWLEYEFKGKPGDVSRRPPLVSPYHWKLDWQMWFAAMSSYQYHPWILNLVSKLLHNDKHSLSLMAKNPFHESPPTYIRAKLYLYQYTTNGEKRQTGNWWKRTFLRDYLPPLSRDNRAFQNILHEQNWE